MLPVAYTLDFSHAAQHLIDVTVALPPEGAELPARAREITLPTWTPGSYLIREYARHIEGLLATDKDGTPIAVAKVDKDRWRIDASANEAVIVRYRVYARELSVRTSYVEDAFALVHPAATFVGLVAGNKRPHTVSVILPPQWSMVLVALPSADGSAALAEAQPSASGADAEAASKATFVAENYDELIDSPFLLGNPTTQTFEVDGKAHVLAIVDPTNTLDANALCMSTERIVAANAKLWRALPYERYIFMHLALGGYGGLEHRASAVTLGEPHALSTSATKQQLYGLLAHEHFHVWNIKRLRPRALGPFDYGREALTTSLWVAEGLTAYYDDLQVCRAGLVDARAYLQALSKTYSQVEASYGRHVQTLGAASLDAWIKFYRPDENSANTAVSYYAKGALLGFVLDAHIRKVTQDDQSLDDVMRLAFERYSGATGYTEQQLRAVISEVCKVDLQQFLAEHIDTTMDWSYDEALALFGLALSPEPTGDDVPKAYVGAQLSFEDGRLMVKQVRRDGPCYHGGINVGDELVALGEQRIVRSNWPQLQLALEPFHTVEFLVSRHNVLKTRSVVPSARQAQAWRITIDEGAPSDAAARRERWLLG